MNKLSSLNSSCELKYDPASFTFLESSKACIISTQKNIVD